MVDQTLKFVYQNGCVLKIYIWYHVLSKAKTQYSINNIIVVAVLALHLQIHITTAA